METDKCLLCGGELGVLLLQPKFICSKCWHILENNDSACHIYYMATDGRRKEIDHMINMNIDKYKRLIKGDKDA